MKKFSVIMPTMWFSDKVLDAISSFNKSTNVDEIILIDNNKAKALNVLQFEKVNHIKPEANLYVNPSWNLGVSLSKNNNLIISNDDVVINNIDDILTNSKIDEYDLIGLDYSNINKGNGLMFRGEITSMQKGFGCFFILNKNKYVNIPHDLKIWYGDAFIFNTIKNRAVFSHDNIDIQLSRTVLKVQDLHSIIDNDKKIFSKIKF